MSMKLLILEGPRGVGKSTLRPLVAAALDHQWHVIDRLCGSMWVYAQLNRKSTATLPTDLQIPGVVVKQVILYRAAAELKKIRQQREIYPELSNIEDELMLFRTWEALSKTSCWTVSLNVRETPEVFARIIAEEVLGADRP